MQLHRLTLCAVGPYAGEHSIDFDRLGASGLFLLEGPTGSGKSSVIDAVVFALFGKVAGDASSDERMRSDFAPPGTTPFVELVFSTSAGLYCVRRTPKFERPKQRGSGTTTQHATATLWRLTSPDAPLGEPLTTRIDETSAQVQDVVGLTREQFVQTMVLPQGEFASFLRAGAEERRSLLQRLFGTEVYDRVQRRLEEMRRQANSERDRAAAHVRERVSAFCGAAALDEAQAEQLLDLVDDPESLRRRCAELAGDRVGLATVTMNEATAAGDHARVAAQELAGALDRKGRAERKASLLGQHERLMAGEGEVEVARGLLDRAERAERVRPSIEALDRATDDLRRAENQLEVLVPALPSDLRSSDASAWSVRVDELESLLAQVLPHVDDEAELVRRGAELAALTQRGRDARERSQDAAAALESLPGQLAAAQDAVTRVRELAAALPAVRAARDAAHARWVAARRAVELRTRLVAAEAELAAATTTVRLAAEREHELRTRYYDGMAGELAQALVVGKPCTVCGSKAHPRPARSSADAVVRADVDAAETERSDAEKAHDVLLQGVADLRAQELVSAEAAGGAAPDEAHAAWQQAEQTVEAHEDAVGQEPDLASEVARLRERELELREALVAAGAAAERVAGEQEAAERELARWQQVVDTWRDGHPDVAARVTELRGRLVPLRGAVEAARGVDTAAKTLARCRDDVIRWSGEHGFADEAAARAALLDGPARAELGALVTRFDEARVAVTSALAAPDLADVEPVPDSALEPLQQRSDDAAARATAALEAAATAQLLAQAAAAAASVVVDALDEHAAELERTAPLLRLANLVTASTADNSRAMTLATYVLIERFRDVVSAANERLSTMSDARYVLQHVEDRSGNRRAGLGLVVLDQRTGQVRDPGTLSGGETFFCSLALALGLADVVSGEAGGVTLGTLFVDEGFGSLDPDALENVLEVLDRLRAGGRVVGVVSHVPELKERISERVVVSRNPDGSSRLAVVA